MPPGTRAPGSTLERVRHLREQLCSCQRSLLQKALLTLGGTMSTTVTTALPTGTWSIDPIHSSIGFGVKHFGISTFRGDFKQAAGSIVTEDGAIRSIEGSVRVENLVTEEPAAHGSPPQRGLLRRRQASRADVQEHVGRAGRGRPSSRHRRPHDPWRHAPGRAGRRDRGRRRRPRRRDARRHLRDGRDRALRLGHHVERPARERRLRRGRARRP